MFLLQKLHERQAVFKKRVYQKDDREKWQKVLTTEMISSEESDPDEEDDRAVNYVKTLPWRADIVKNFFYDLHTSGN